MENEPFIGDYPVVNGGSDKRSVWGIHVPYRVPMKNGEPFGATNGVSQLHSRLAMGSMAIKSSLSHINHPLMMQYSLEDDVKLLHKLDEGSMGETTEVADNWCFMMFLPSDVAIENGHL